MTMLTYLLPQSGQEIVFTEDVLAHFKNNRQYRCWSREAGGQLFARLSDSKVEICHATGPRKQDKRGRFFFIPNRKMENAEIKNKFSEGLHYVGDWHSHPQKSPSPSGKDISSIEACFRKSDHQLIFFILVIVGQTNPPEGLWVSCHNCDGATRLCLKGALEPSITNS